MPCYDPPPPWEGAQRQNAEEATKILCAIVSEMLTREQIVSRRLLEWFLCHRKIDLQIATTGWYGKPDKEEAEKIKADIERVQRLLSA